MQESSFIDLNEIDLRPYWDEIKRAWIWIIAVPLLVLIGGYVAQQFVLEKDYEAVSLVAVSAPTINLEFDPRFTTQENELSFNRSLPELAVSDDIMLTLFNTLEDQLPAEISSQFRLESNLEATPGNIATLVRLSATFSDPELAALVANEWATIFIESTNRLLGTDPSAALSFVNTELERSETDLKNTENELLAFVENDKREIISANLNEDISKLQSTLRKKSTFEFLLNDLTAYQEVLAAQEEQSSSTNMENTLLFMFQVRALELDLNSVELNIDNFEGLDRPAVLDYLNSLAQVISARVDELNAIIEEIEPSILESKSLLAQLDIESRRLEDNTNIQRETFLTLSRKVQEDQINSGVEGVVRLASRAAVPASPNGSLFLVILSSFMAFLSVFSFLILKVWWQQQRPASIMGDVTQ